MSRPNEQRAAGESGLNRMWDLLLEQETLSEGETGWESIETIRRIHDLDDAPGPDRSMVEAIWSDVAESSGLQRGSSVSLARQNGLVIDQFVEASLDDAVSRTHPSIDRVLSVVQRAIRSIAIAVAAGFVVGLVVIGGGARLAMRIAAMLSPDQLQGASTKNSETVGEMSIDGSLFLIITGGFAGIASGMAFLAIKAWLPERGWRRGLTAGLIFVAAGGAAVLENGRNPDYERLGIAGVNICLFLAIPLVYGFVIGSVTDKLEARIDRRLPRLQRSIRALVGSLLMVGSLMFAIMGAGMLIGTETPLPLLLLTPVFGWIAPRISRRIPDWVAVRPVYLARILAIGIPCLIGVVLTLQAIARIV